jgi:hypothetical protein
VFGAFLAIRGASNLFRWRKSHLKPFFYATRLYFIRADVDDVWIWPFTEARNFAVAKAGNIVYHLEFKFADWTQRVVVTANEARRLEVELKRWHQESESALLRNDLDYMIAHDDFLALREKRAFHGTPCRPKRTQLVGQSAAGILAGLALVSGIDHLATLRPSIVSSWFVDSEVPNGPTHLPPSATDFRPAAPRKLVAVAKTPGQDVDYDALAAKYGAVEIVPGMEQLGDFPPPAAGMAVPSALRTNSATTQLRSVPAQPAKTWEVESQTPIVNAVPKALVVTQDACQASMDDPELHRPRNGEEFDAKQAEEGHGTLTIINGNSEDAAVIISNSALDGFDRLVYVRAGMTATMEAMSPGQYHMIFQTGRGWDEQAEDFKCASGTWSFDRTASFEEEETADGIEYSDISVTLHKLVDGNARTTRIDPTAFRRRRRN